MANTEKSVVSDVVHKSESLSTKRIYKTNYITRVIFKVDFPKILELNESNPPAEFQKIISEKFPLVNEIKQFAAEFKINDAKKPSKVTVKNKNELVLSWEFSNKEKTKKVFVDANFLYIEYLKYNHFDEFFQDIDLIFGTFIKLYPVKVANRIGLRYINEIKLDSGDPMDWNNLIHKSLYCVPKELSLSKDALLRSMHGLEFKENGNRLIFQFGLFNSDYPNPIARKEFVLDYDCFIFEERDISEIYRNSKEFNRLISEWFEKSILDELRNKMDGVKNDK